MMTVSAKTFRRLVVACGLAGMALGTMATPAAAKDPVQLASDGALSAKDAADLRRVEKYLNGIESVVAGFIQVNHNGTVSQGRIYVARPGKMRVEYDPPANMVLVATGVWLIFYDGELEETTYLPLRSSPVSFLLKENMRFGEDVKVLTITRAPGLLRIKVREVDEDEGGATLTLTFKDNPLSLKQWVVRDDEGRDTKLALLDPQLDVPIKPERFQFVSPKAREGRFNKRN